MVNPQPTRTVSGQVLRTNKTPFGEPGFTLRAFDAISPSNIVPLGNPIPLPANGSYRLSYTWQSTGGRNGPNLLVRVFNPQGTIVGEATKPFAGMQETLNITVNVPPPPPPPPNFTLACTVRNQLTTTTIPNLRVEATFRVNNQILLTRSGTTNAEGLVLFNLDRAIFNPIPQGQSIRVIFQVYQEVQLLPTSTTLPNFQLEDQKVEILVNRPEWLVEELVVEGTITHRDGQPLAGILVQTVDRDLRNEHPLGEQVTNNQGAYRILYNRARFNPADRLIAGKSQADIRFRLFDPARQPLTDFQVTASNAIVKTIKIKNETGQVVPIQVIFNAPAITVANLSVNDTRFRSESEYDRHLRETAAVLGNIPFRTVEDIELEFLAPETDIPAQHLTFMRAADTLAAQTNIIAEAFYGLFRQNLPTDVGLLSIRTAEEQRAALKQSIADNIISNRLESNLEAIVTQLQNLLTSYAAGTISGGSALGNLLNTVLPDTALRRQFVTEYAAYDGKDSEAFWARLRTQPAFQNGLADNIRFTFEISTLTHNHLPLVQLLQQERTQGRVRSFKDLARLDESGWLRLINTSFNGRLVGIPEDIPGENATEKARNYAGLMTRLTEASFPTVAIAARLEQDNLPGKADLLTFLTNNPEFEIDRTPFRRYVNERGTNVLRGVQNPDAIAAAQRTFMIARRFALMKPLLEAQLDSALAITRLGETRFVANYAQAMGGQTQAQLVYQRADQRTAYATAWLAKHNFAFDRVRSWVIPTETPTDLGPTLIPDLEVLFGSLTACACEHCRSIYSPAAYLVDSLAFLEQNKNGLLDAFSLLDAFKSRRPDIAGLKLSCKNTNTPLPYIDLVNEVLEQVIAGELDAITPPQTEGDPENLRVMPEHIIRSVYESESSTQAPLKNAVYPAKLPFDLPLETVQTYLKHLGTGRAELMQLFRPGDSPEFVLASLGMTTRDYEILTGKTLAGENAALPALYEFFGYSSEESLERLSGVPGVGIRELLDRAEISYHDLIELLATEFVNPSRVVNLNANEGADCDLTQYQLAGVTPDFLTRLHRFLRLRRILGWSIADLDLTLRAFGRTTPDATVIQLDELRKLPHFIWLKTELNLSLEELTCFYSTINIQGENSLYFRLFQNKAVTNPVNPAFQLRQPSQSGLQGVPVDPAAAFSQIEPQQIPIILAAFRIREADWITLQTARVGNLDRTLPNLSQLYRHVLLARILRLSILDLLLVQKLLGNPFESANPVTTVQFIEQVRRIQRSRFKIAHLTYLYLHEPDVAAVMEPSDEQLRSLIRTLRAGLKTPSEPIASIPPEAELRDELMIDTQRSAGERITGLNLAQIEEVLAFLRTRQSDTPANRAAVDRLFGRFLSRTETERADTYRILLGEQTTQAKIEYVVEPLKTHNLRQELEQGLVNILPPATITSAITFLTTLQENTSENQAQVGQLFGKFLNPTEALPQLLRSATSNPKVSAKLNYVLKQLRQYITRQNLVVQTLADALKLDSTIARLLLEALLSSQTSSDRPAISDFLNIPLEDSNPPGSETIPAQFRSTFIRLQKAALLINSFTLTAKELEYFVKYASDFANFNLNQLPINQVNDQTVARSLFQQWERLHHYSTLRDSLPERKTTLIDVFVEARRTEATLETARVKLTEATGWEDLPAFSLRELQDERRLVTLQKQITLIRRVGVSIEQLQGWATILPSLEQAQQIRQTVKAKYNETQWLAIARPLEDHLREKRREALVAYLIHRPGRWLPPTQVTALANAGRQATTNLLYEHFLIDVEMSACQLTSRVRQAIAAVQLFVQRCLMGLEGTLTIEPMLARRWETWMKTYRFWEANRKVFVYPENWIEPELRDDKTPFFKDLENALLQNDVTQETVETAFRRYLEQLNEVARLDIVGMYIQEEARTIHVFGRTPGIPHRYFYRKLILLSTATKWTEGYWTPWEKVELDIEGDHLIPVVWNRRLYLFWAIFTEKAEQDQVPEEPDNDSDCINGQPAPPEETPEQRCARRAREREERNRQRTPNRYWEIQLAYSEFHNGQWSAKGIIENQLDSRQFVRKLFVESHLHTFDTVTGDALVIRCYCPILGYVLAIAEFRFDSCGMSSTTSYSVTATPIIPPKGSALSNLSYGESRGGRRAEETDILYLNEGTISNFPIEVSDFVNRISGDAVTRISSWIRQKQDIRVLDITPGIYTLSNAQQGLQFIASRSPFFYRDNSRVFFITKEIPQAPPSQAPMAKVNPWDLSHIRQGVANKQWESNLVRRNPDRINPDRIALPPNGSQSNQANQPLVNFNQFIISSPFIDTGLMQRLSETWKRYHFITFYHPYVCLFLTQLNRDSIDGLLNPNPSSLRGAAEPEDSKLRRQRNRNEYFDREYQPNRDVVAPVHLDPVEEIDFELEGAYSQYNWELFFHAPLLVADRLMQNQKFAEAQKWFHYIFDPTVGSDPTVTQPDPARFWKLRPFYEIANQRQTIEQLMRSLNAGNQKLKNQVDLWRENPFNPHLMARMRITAYMKTTVMKYLDNLIAWGDYLFRQDTLETLAEATQIYILAANLLGDRPESIPPRAVPADRTFTELAVVGLDAFSNALVRAEESLPAFDDDPSTPGSDRPPIPVLYFCIPPNDKLLSYWDIVSDRLFKIRHCMNIEGIVRQLPLFDPPIDPDLLVRARSMGVDLRDVLSGAVSLSPYRFNVMLQKANELCAEVKSLGAALLSAYEKRDAEELAQLRSEHEIRLLDAIKDVRKKQVEEAKETKASLERSRETITERWDFYRDIEYMNDAESASMILSTLSSYLGLIANGMSVGGASAASIPDITIGIAGWAGSPMTIATTGGQQASNIAGSWAKAFEMLSGYTNILASLSGTMGSYKRRWDDWKLQERLAQKELAQIDKQIAAADIRLQIAQKELENHELQRRNAKEVDEYMRRKFTNQELYNWMVSEISAIYFQSYQLAYETARRAEQAYRFERGLTDSSFIRFGQWDSLRRGLMAGERLQLDLRRLEMAYLNENRREYELTKHISLTLLNPLALIKLKETGQCLINLPEEIFDLDYPGHYFRRIKSVSITLPCVAGPYTTISCTLRLLRNSIRINTSMTDGYPRNVDEAGLPTNDPRFVENNIPVKAIATSTAQNDSGVFELSFRDERYLPFEGAGAISQWSLELFNDNSPDFGKALRQFDYSTITDAILHIKYTAREDAGALKNGAIAHLRDYFSEDGTTPSLRMFNLRQEFPSQWHRFLHPINPEEGNNFELEIIPNLFPIRDTEKTLKVNKICLLARCKNKNAGNYTIVVTLPAPEPSPVSEPPPAETHILTLTPVNQYGGLHFSQKDVGIEIDLAATPVKWQLRMSRSGGNVPEEVEDVLLVLGYEWENNA